MLYIYTYIGSIKKIPLGFINENNKWMQIRDGQKNDSGIDKIKPSMEILRLSNAGSSLGTFFHCLQKI